MKKPHNAGISPAGRRRHAQNAPWPQTAVRLSILLLALLFGTSGAQAQNDSTATGDPDPEVQAPCLYQELNTSDPQTVGLPFVATAQLIQLAGGIDFNDWFDNAYPLSSATVQGIIDINTTPWVTSGGTFPDILSVPQNQNLTWERRMKTTLPPNFLDAVAARDYHSAGNDVDQSMFTSGTDANGANPTTWSAGTGSIPQKNDIIDVGGHIRFIPNGAGNHLVAYAFASTRNTSGDANLDFEIFVSNFQRSGSQFINGGPDAGHTALRQQIDPGTGRWILDQESDILVSLDYGNGGSIACAAIWLWVDPNNLQAPGQPVLTVAGHNAIAGTPNSSFTYFFSGEFFNGPGAGPYGYARILPVGFNTPGHPNFNNNNFIHAAVNSGGPEAAIPVWGNLAAQNAAYQTTINTLQLAEVAVDFTALGLIPNDLNVTGPCDNLFGTLMVKTRASGSITAQLKDFAGPYQFGVIFQPPTITCPPDTTVSCVDDVPTGAGSFAEFINAGGTITFPPQSTPLQDISYTDGPLTPDGCGGQIERIYTINDSCGNTLNCTQIITVDDNTNPEITGPGNLTLGCNPVIPPGQPGDATATDNCGTVNVTVLPDVITGTCNKTLTRTWRATDVCGNTADHVQIITYKTDNQAPEITANCPGGNLGCNPTNAQLLAALGTATVSDNCDNSLTATFQDQTTGGPCLFTRTRTWNATDLCGNTATPVTCSVTYKVDTQAPVINVNCPGGNIGCNPLTSEINTALGTATVTDNCDNGLNATFQDQTTNNGCNYTTTRTWNVSDLCGNAAIPVTCSVSYKIDTQDPVINVNCPGGNLGCNPTNAQLLAALGTATVSDNCDNGLTATFQDQTTGGPCLFTRTRTWNATDLCGNAATPVTCSVTYKVDTQAPVITVNCPGGNLGCNPLTSEINTALGTATVTDNCDNGLNATFQDQTTNNGCNYTTTRTWNVSDLCGNAATPVSCSVSYKIDTQAPVINVNCPGGNIGCNPTNAQLLAALGTATVSDNCDNGLTATFQDQTTGGPCNFTRTRTWNVSDLCGNDATPVTCSVNYTVDTTPPVVSCNVPGGVITVCEGSTINYPTPSATDNCTPGSLTVTCTPANPIPSPGSSVTVTCTATDACGNVGTCTYSIRVVRNPSCSINLPDPKPFANSCNNIITADVNGLDGNTTYTWTVTGGAGWSIQSSTGASATYCAGTGSAIFCLEVKNIVNGVECISTCCDTVECQPTVLCSYTQGYYGNQGGMNCTGNNTTYLLGIQLATDLVLGRPVNNRTLTIGAGSINCVYDLLPGGGPSAVLPANENNNCSSLGSIPRKSNGTLRNVLLAQTITLGLNLRIPGSGLGGLEITGPYMVTYESTVTSCPSSTPGSPTGTPIVRMIPISVVNYLSGGDNTVQGLFDLANFALGTDPALLPVGFPSLSAINGAVSAFNEGFDECRILDGFYQTNPLDTVSGTTTTRSIEAASSVGISVYPNPAKSMANIEFILNGNDSEVTLEIYNINGVRVDVLFNANAEADVLYRTQLDAGQLPSGIYTYRLTTKGGVYTDRFTIVK